MCDKKGDYDGQYIVAQLRELAKKQQKLIQPLNVFKKN